MDKEQVIDIVRRYKQNLKPEFANAKIYLFGSYSKGCATKDSDIDVAVEIPECTGNWLQTSASLWEATLGVSTLIEPVLLETKDQTPFYREVMRTGVVI